MKNINTLLLGTGYTLTRLASELGSNEVLLTTRSQDKKKLFEKKGYNVELLDVDNLESLEKLFDSYSEISTVIDSIPPREADLFGVNNVCSILKNRKVSRLFYLSTTGVFGETSGAFVNETSPTNPITEKGSYRLQSEKLYGELSEVKTTAFRIAGIYGPGRGTGLSLKNGRYPYIDNGSRWSNRIHVDDIVGILKASLESKKLSKVYCLSDTKPSLTSEIIEYYCNKFSFDMPLSISLEEAKKRGMYTLISNQRVSSELVRKDLDYIFKYPTYVEGAGSEFT